MWTNSSECRTFWRESPRIRRGQSVPPTPSRLAHSRSTLAANQSTETACHL